jgi:hypothetical protein
MSHHHHESQFTLRSRDGSTFAFEFSMAQFSPEAGVIADQPSQGRHIQTYFGLKDMYAFAHAILEHKKRRDQEFCVTEQRQLEKYDEMESAGEHAAYVEALRVWCARVTAASQEYGRIVSEKPKEPHGYRAR